MIVLPIIGALSGGTVALWALGGVVGGVFGWLTRKVLKTKNMAQELELRLDKLEGH
jgi:hypothetical protein